MRANFGEFLSMFRGSNLGSMTRKYNNEQRIIIRRNEAITIGSLPSRQGLLDLRARSLKNQGRLHSLLSPSCFKAYSPTIDLQQNADSYHSDLTVKFLLFYYNFTI